MRIARELALTLSLTGLAVAADLTTPAARIKQGHSRHGETFDEGPREKPWEMPAIGRTHFPITHKNPEVQKWFDQGHTLLHSFWDFEAERAFRWCLKLEPENAMAWWGLSRATADERSDGFVREAARRKHTVTERERLYIEASEKMISRDALRDRGDDYRNRNDEYRKLLETIAVKYPGDMEARALLALTGIGEARYATEKVIAEVLAKEPDHPGAHHYRIHNWNYHEPEQALASCRRYGAIAPGAGHALHMPGHVFATVGMWDEAAIAMDSATRAEKQYMRERMIFPFNAWNYGHNRNYLNYILEQLAQPEAAVFGARQMMDAPLDPKANGDKGFSTHSQGIASMLRTLVKFEKWKELLDPETIPWREPLFGDKVNRKYAEARAHLGLGDAIAAEKAIAVHADFEKDSEKVKEIERAFKIQKQELKARLALLKGDRLRGLAWLAAAAEDQFEMQRTDNDPPHYPELLYNALGRAYLEARSPALAAQAFEKSLEAVRQDWFALAGLVQAQHALGGAATAGEAMARLAYVTEGAPAGLAWLERARATGVRAEARDGAPAPQRRYKSMALDRFGPAVWEPWAAPKLSALDPEGKTVTLEEYRGRKNVLLVFYLGKECLHCLKQLRDIEGRKGDWERLDAAVLAVSGNQPAANKAALATMAVPGARILSDAGFANARRFHAYDDFEEMEIHATLLIDKQGRVHWARSGGEPFGDMDFLVRQIERMNR